MFVGEEGTAEHSVGCAMDSLLADRGGPIGERGEVRAIAGNQHHRCGYGVEEDLGSTTQS